MKRILVLSSIILSFIISQGVYADENVLGDTIPYCFNFDLHVQPIGFKCDSSSEYGFPQIYTRVNLNNFSEAWQRESDRSIWALKKLSGGPISVTQAIKICSTEGARIPSAQEFMILGKYGRIESDVPSILGIDQGHYWTSSKTPDGKPIFLNGWGGGLEEWEDYRIPPEDVICVK